MRLGVAMLNVTMGVGWRETEVKEDMVMPRGVCLSPPVDMAVHITTECGRRRITERSCSGRGRLSCGPGWTEGGVGAEAFHVGGALLCCGEEDEDVKGLCAEDFV